MSFSARPRSMFVQNSWYVFGWSHEVAEPKGLLGRVIIGQPIVVWRDGEGVLHAMEDRCPHRHAPMSRGKVHGDTIRCMYHGMTFSTRGECVDMPLVQPAPDCRLRTYPVTERDDWIWVWTGEPGGEAAIEVPRAIGINAPGRPMMASQIEYDAHYQLLHDNLCDLSHVDFVHRESLKRATGADWAETAPRITHRDRGLRFERWFEEAELPGKPELKVDTWIEIDFTFPGIFVMQGERHAAGTAAACNRQRPLGIEPLMRNFEQQAVTPVGANRTAYFYATGLSGNTSETDAHVTRRMAVVNAAFEEDRQMIEAQQQIWNLTSADHTKHFLPQDKGPFLMRKLVDKLLKAERG
ncbi:Rieske 2Fe-2S domain-containing protein [Altererythrobacter salegens]|uniref:Rieske 2Fe-2S domain-containing protein n=1 Tax=Croceibacterium salegens TaxID=1737568 RepID=A0A6I4SZ62_9SPHN|nr:aromatic ring-hydroxylating dioxygenase subunit alpha [Croceibacterium salegens]MXO60669.1 Rieske 2Fe-2S domain-containing protein [Croceibacterium salegens]